MKHDSIGWKATRWHAWLHDSRAEMGGLQGAEDDVTDAVVTQLAPRVLSEEATDEDLEAMGAGVSEITTAIGRGLYARLYAEPSDYEGGPAWARSVLEAIQEAGDLDELRALCGADPDMTAIATTTILRDVAKKMPDLFDALDEEERDPQAEPEDEQEEGDGPPGIPGGDQPGEGPGDGEGPGGDEGDGGDEEGESAVLAAIGAAMAGAVRKAIREVAEAKSELDGILPGLGTANPMRRDDPRRLKLLDRLRHDLRLQQILRIAGRIRRVADRVRLVPSPDLRIELADIERGADLPQVLPSELIGLDSGEEVLELLALKNLVDRSMLQRRMTGTERLGRGPMVVLLDASASMGVGLADGLDRMGWAAAIAIATLRAGVEENRSVSVCVFDGQVRKSETWQAPAGDRAASELAVLGVAGVRAGGGTVFDSPICWGLDHGAERDRADLILVTDGEAYVSAPVVERLKASRNRGLRLWGVLAGEGGFSGVLDQISDGVTEVTGKGGEDAIGLIGGMGAT